MYSSSKLFPIDDERMGKEGVTSAVIGVKIGMFNVDYPITSFCFTVVFFSVGPHHIEPSHSVMITMRAPHSNSYEITPFTPVYWDEAIGKWSSQGCHFGHHWQDHIVFSCRKAGYYGLMQDITYSNVTVSFCFYVASLKEISLTFCLSNLVFIGLWQVQNNSIGL